MPIGSRRTGTPSYRTLTTVPETFSSSANASSATRRSSAWSNRRTYRPSGLATSNGASSYALGGGGGGGGGGGAFFPVGGGGGAFAAAGFPPPFFPLFFSSRRASSALRAAATTSASMDDNRAPSSVTRSGAFFPAAVLFRAFAAFTMASIALRDVGLRPTWSDSRLSFRDRDAATAAAPRSPILVALRSKDLSSTSPPSMSPIVSVPSSSRPLCEMSRMRIVALTFTKAAKRAAHRAPKLLRLTFNSTTPWFWSTLDASAADRSSDFTLELSANTSPSFAPQTSSRPTFESRSVVNAQCESFSRRAQFGSNASRSASTPVSFGPGLSLRSKCVSTLLCVSPRAIATNPASRTSLSRRSRRVSETQSGFLNAAATAATAASPSARCRSSHRSLSVASPRVAAVCGTIPAARHAATYDSAGVGGTVAGSIHSRPCARFQSAPTAFRAGGGGGGGGGGGVSSAAGRASSAGVSAGSSLVAVAVAVAVAAGAAGASSAGVSAGAASASFASASRAAVSSSAFASVSSVAASAAAGSGSATSGASAWATSLALSASSSSAAAATTTSADAPPPPSSSSSAFPASAASAAAAAAARFAFIVACISSIALFCSSFSRRALSFALSSLIAAARSANARLYPASTARNTRSRGHARNRA
eukprot:31467-Pelagococcus_subviridis.AAC.2